MLEYWQSMQSKEHDGPAHRVLRVSPIGCRDITTCALSPGLCELSRVNGNLLVGVRQEIFGLF